MTPQQSHEPSKGYETTGPAMAEKSTNPSAETTLPPVGTLPPALPSVDVVPSMRGWPPVTSTRIGIAALGLCSICGVLGAITGVVMERSGEDIAIVATLAGTAIGSLAGFLNSVWQR